MKNVRRKPPKYCHGFIDRYGKARWYYRPPNAEKAVPLPGLPWSPTFMAAYEQASVGEDRTVTLSEKRIKPGSVDAVAVAYYRSYEYGQLKPITKQTYRNMIERFRAEHGDKPIARIERGHVKAMMAKRQDQPQAANGILRIVRILMRQALEMGLRKDNPTVGIKRMRSRTGGFKTWTEEHIAQFEACFEPGSRARLALTLMLTTGQRRSDIIRLGWQHLRGGRLVVTQQKNGAVVSIPLHPDLQRALSTLPRSNMTFLINGYGKPFTPAGFGNWFRDRVQEAGLPDGLSAHGLRKAVCRRLAEAGCTPNQIMAISGHRTLGEVERYTREASRIDLADSAFDVLARVSGGGDDGADREQNSANSGREFAKPRLKSLK